MSFPLAIILVVFFYYSFGGLLWILLWIACGNASDALKCMAAREILEEQLEEYVSVFGRGYFVGRGSSISEEQSNFIGILHDQLDYFLAEHGKHNWSCVSVEEKLKIIELVSFVGPSQLIRCFNFAIDSIFLQEKLVNLLVERFLACDNFVVEYYVSEAVMYFGEPILPLACSLMVECGRASAFLYELNGLLDLWESVGSFDSLDNTYPENAARDDFFDSLFRGQEKFADKERVIEYLIFSRDRFWSYVPKNINIVGARI